MGIYKITNKINNQCYIGQSICIEERWKEHIRCSKDLSNKNSIYLAIRKYGIENFDFEIIEECNSVDELDEKEINWIAYYNSYNNGYNMTRGGTAGRRFDYDYIVDTYLKFKNVEKTAEICQCHWHTVSQALKAKNIPTFAKANGYNHPVKQIDPNTLQVINIYNSISEAASAVKCSLSAISMALSGQHKAAAGFIWKNIDFDESTLQKEKIKNMHSNQKLLQLDKNTGEVLNIYNSVKEALIALGRECPTDGNIYNVCKGKRKTAYGFKWKFEPSGAEVVTEDAE